MPHPPKAPPHAAASGSPDSVPSEDQANDVDTAARRKRWPSRIEIGRVVKPHGVRGEVALEIWGEIGEALRPGAALLMGRRATEVVSLRGAGDRVLARLVGLDDRDAAENARGQVLSVASSGLPLPADDEEYLFELEGCLVEVEQGNPVELGNEVEQVSTAVTLGRVERVIEDGGGLLLEVAGRAGDADDGDDVVFLIPYVSAYLRCKDLARGVLRFTLPEGLLETCVSTS